MIINFSLRLSLFASLYTCMLPLLSNAFFVQQHQVRTAPLSETFTDEQQSMLTIQLEKPLGLILEEVEKNQPRGVYILELDDDGSAASSQWLKGLKVSTVMGNDVTNLDFDSVMDQLVAAPSPITMEFASMDDDQNSEEDGQFPQGTVVSIKILDDKNNDETVIEGVVGENLRKLLLANNVEIYQGMKQKLGNCGGGGQCTFCAVDFVDSEGWNLRSDYEDKRLPKSPNARLSCLNNIEGPATIRL